MNFGTKGCIMYNCGDSCTGECMKSMSREQNARILTDLLEYLKEQHSNLPTHVFEVLGEVIDDLKQYKVMNEFYQLKSECELPATLLTYTYKDFEGVLHPFASIHIDFRDSDEINIQKMEKVKSKYGEFFMFFNNSKEGKEFWKKQSITITTKQYKVMNKEQQELVNEAYKNYRSKSKDIDLPENLYNKLIDDLNKDAMFPIDNPNRMLTKEQFINKCKTDSEFSQKWGLKIEERELSLEERYKIMQSNISTATLGIPRMYNNEYYNSKNIPTKLIKVTYNDKTIESYES